MPYPLIKAMEEQLEQTGLKTSDIDQVVNITQAIFGSEWLENLIDTRKETQPFLQHPIMNGCSSGSFTHLMKLIELCTYCVSFKDDKELQKIISSLKEVNSYGDMLFQLAMAYRFKKLGFDIILEPKINNGKLADFKGGMGSLKIVSECTVLREWGVRAEERGVFWECVKELKLLHKKNKNQIVIDIVSKISLSFKDLQRLKKDIIEAGKLFLNTEKTSQISNESYDVYVSEMDAEMRKKLNLNRKEYFKNSGWDQILSFALAKEQIPGDLTSVNLERPTDQSFIRYKTTIPPEEYFLYSLENKINKKVQDKSGQLKSHPDEHISMLFVQIEDKLEKADFDRVSKRLYNNVFKKIRSLNGVFLARRDWTSDLMHKYHGTFLQTPSIH